jgi:hypothetical protein
VLVLVVVDTLFFLGGGRSSQKDRMTSDAGNVKYILRDANYEHINSIELGSDLAEHFDINKVEPSGSVILSLVS